MARAATLLWKYGRGLETDHAVHLSVGGAAGGLLLNALAGWSWADPVAGLVIAALAVGEGVEAWRGDAYDDPVIEPAAQARLARARSTEPWPPNGFCPR